MVNMIGLSIWSSCFISVFFRGGDAKKHKNMANLTYLCVSFYLPFSLHLSSSITFCLLSTPAVHL